MHVGVAWKRVLKAVDYGNAPIDRLSVERSMSPVRELVREIAEAGAIPVVIGGDHSLEYPNVAGVADVYGKENIGVIHFDAHYDAAADGYSGHLMSHASRSTDSSRKVTCWGATTFKWVFEGIGRVKTALNGCGRIAFATTRWWKLSATGGQA